MKFLLIAFVFVLSSINISAQEGTQIGLKINAGWKLNTHRAKTIGLISAENGYGFSLGVPLRKWRSEDNSVDSGLEYEYTAFDSYASGQLQSSFRIQSVGIPILYNARLKENWFWQAGGGLNVTLLSRGWNPVFVENYGPISNRIQPYFMGGITTLAKRNNHFFEFGLQARYLFLDLWKRDTDFHKVSTSKLFIIDSVLKFYLQ